MNFTANNILFPVANRLIFNISLTEINILVPEKQGLKRELIHKNNSFCPTGNAVITFIKF
jgi:hypothetical protein